MKNKIVILIILLTIIEIFFLYGTTKYKTVKINEYLKDKESELQKSYESSINNGKYIASIIYKSIVKDTKLLSEFAKAKDANDDEKAVIRNKIISKLEISYQQQNEMGVKQLQFHLPDATSFLRMHEKNKFGDSLIGTRFSVEKANRLQNPVEGFEEGRTFNGYRFIFPLFYEMEHIGSIGIGISACSMIENMNKLYEGLHDFIIKKNVVNSRVFQADTYNYSPTTVSEDYLRENLSFEQLSGENSIFENIQEFFTTNRINYEKVNKNISQGKAFSVFNKVNGKDLITTFFPIFNVEGKHIGYITNYVKDSRIPKLSNMVSFTILAGTITIIFIFGFIYQVILNFEKSRLLNSVLDEKLKENAQQLELKEQMLFQQSKLATLGEMFSALAHQWKQPLNILAMYIQSMLDEEMDENERQEREELIDRCMIQITYMSETINDFMDFIKPSSNVASKTELVKSTEDVIRLLTPSLKNKKIDIKVSIENDIHGKIYAYGNPNEIRHILVNIINNAKDAIMEIKETNRKFHGKIDIKILSEKNKSIIVTQVSHL